MLFIFVDTINLYSLIAVALKDDKDSEVLRLSNPLMYLYRNPPNKYFITSIGVFFSAANASI